MKQAWLACLLGFVTASAYGAEVPDGAFAWLQRMATAAHQLNYTGSFVYQHGQQVETSRITHLTDASGEHEKLVTLDGSPRQIFRNNDEVYCFLADDKTVMVDKHHASTGFPALLPQQIADLKEYYDVRLDGRERVAGRDCQVIYLAPKDQFRYGHRLWADIQTGLLLKTSTWSDQKDIVDQFTFTDIKIGAPIDRNDVRPALNGKKLIRSTGEGNAQPLPIDAGWEIGPTPPGFKKIMAVKRVLPGASVPVNHIVFSDGLAAASVFIEPASNKTTLGLSHQGAMHMYTRKVAGYQVKVLGEVPSATVMQIGDAVSFRK
jgi:sigma-E factor negative regulatory protein RseB